MCWSGEASIALSAVGVAGTIWAAYKKEPPQLWMCLGYFTLMEILQAYTYTVINECHDPGNQIATLLGYLHITFQIFFINAVSLHFIDQGVVKKIQPFVYTVCFAAAIMMMIKLYPFAWAGLCEAGVRPMCGAQLCSVDGNWHIAWEVPVNTINDGFSWYLLAGFILPILYGSWRFTLYHFLMGPALAYTTTDNVNEWPAVWCLLSIGFMLIVVKTPVRKVLYMKKKQGLARWL